MYLKNAYLFGIEPVVTMTHYDMPWNLALKYGGWKNRKLIDLFVKNICKNDNNRI